METRQKPGETRRHIYNHVSEPDRLVVIDFAATSDTAEVTVELERNDDGELRVSVKCGPDAEYLLDEWLDIEHSEVLQIDFSQDSPVDFVHLLGFEPGATQDDYRQHFEHGQWWIVATVSGETWSVVEEIGEDGTPAVGFELISEGAEQ